MHVALRDRQGPLILEGLSPLGNRMAVIGFDLHASDLPLSADFPVLVANLVHWTVPSSLVNQQMVQPGQQVQISLPADSTRLQVLLPDGSDELLAANGSLLRPGSVTFGDTQMPGVYRVNLIASGKPVQAAFAVNVAPATQPPVRPVPQASLQTAQEAPAKAGSVPEELTGGVIVLILCVLSGEWFMAMRRR
jgi:hypothetical protein